MTGLNDLSILGYRSRPLKLRDPSREFEIVNNAWTELSVGKKGCGYSKLLFDVNIIVYLLPLACSIVIIQVRS